MRFKFCFAVAKKQAILKKFSLIHFSKQYRFQKNRNKLINCHSKHLLLKILYNLIGLCAPAWIKFDEWIINFLSSTDELIMLKLTEG